MKKVLLGLLLSCLATVSVRADLIWYESFNYPDGCIETNAPNDQPGVTNWFCHSPDTPMCDALVNNQKLEIGSSPGRQDDIHRFLENNNGWSYTNYDTTPPLYVSMTVNFAQLPSSNGVFFAHFSKSATDFLGQLWALTGNPSGSNVFVGLPGTYRLGVSSAAHTTLSSPSVIYPVDLATNTDYQVVMSFNQDTVATYLWVNPLSSADCNVNSTDTFAPTNQIHAFNFRQAQGFAADPTATAAVCTISNLAVATTFDEAATNVRPNTATAPVFAIAPQNTTNYLYNPMMLWAVVNGQSQCALTYQWQKAPSSSPGTFANIIPSANIPSATSNALNIISATTSDDGRYRLIATNPNSSLSSTSAPVWLWVFSQSGPPQISGQPANASVYYGQTAGFTVAASGEAPLTYAWYYNTASNYSGCLINETTCGATCINETTATLSVQNVQAANGTAGYYYCHVTANNGQSTNTAIAKLTAVPPVATTIGYLRTLIDPVTLKNTNTTTFWAVTGVCISKTNFTTANNASYFIQDSTAGICVYWTGNSTFRPNGGDIISVVGPLSDYAGLQEFALNTTVPGTSATVIGHTNLPPALVLPLNFTNSPAYGYCTNVIKTISGSLVAFTNVYFPDGFASNKFNNYSSSSSFPMTNAQGDSVTLYAYYHFDNQFLTNLVPKFAYRVTGVLSYHIGNASNPSANFQVEPTGMEDFLLDPTITTITLTAGQPTLKWPVASITPYSVWRATNVTGPYVPLATNLTFTSPDPPHTNAWGQYTDPNPTPDTRFYKITSP